MKQAQTILAVLALTCTATIFSCTKEQEENKANVQTEAQTYNGLFLKEDSLKRPPIYYTNDVCTLFAYTDKIDTICESAADPFWYEGLQYIGMCGIMITLSPNSACQPGNNDVHAIAEMEYNNGHLVLTNIRFDNVSDKDTNLDKLFAPLATEGEIYIGGISIIPDETMKDEDFEDVEFPAKKYPFHKEGSNYIITIKE
ncbi:MAG: hypothetical protein IJ684_00010 [Bacteroidales bacterium]|nr:hypothetical protein [Bacteroidales bacterium]